MDDYFGILDLVAIAAGLYVGYQWYCLQFKREISTGLLLRGDVNVARCKDKENYIREASPMLLILTVVLMLDGAVGLINSYVMALPLAVTMGAIFLCLIVLVWFGTRSRKLYEKYWDAPKNIRR